MDKRVLKRYLKGSRRETLETSCFEFDNGYLISDSYSVIKLNEPYILNVAEDKYNISKFYDNFKWNFETFKEFEPLVVSTMKIDEKYEINMDLFQKIKKIIRGNKFTILENKERMSYLKYIIKLENTKTNEVGYMLPMRVY